MRESRSRLALAVACAATVGAQVIAGKATRDALFLTSLDITALPTMVVTMSIVSIAAVAVHVRISRFIRPSRLVPALFFLSATLFVVEWLLRSTSPAAVAVAVYLHTSTLGPLVASGFWLITSERFDPHSARKRFGQIAGAGTLGGLLSALVAERAATRFGVPAMLPWLAFLQFLCAYLVWLLAAAPAHGRMPENTGTALAPMASVRTITQASYLRRLALLVLLGATSAALVDYVFKARAVEAFGRGDHLLRFFALYYAGTSILTFALQTFSSSGVLGRFGLAFSASTPSLALVVGGIGSLVSPAFGALVAARGGEAVMRGSLYSAGYELFYTPIPQEEKRAAKSIIDVGVDRMGDAVGGTLVRLGVMLAPVGHVSVLLGLGIACSAGAIVVASRLNRVYVQTLERSLMRQSSLVAQDTPNTLRTLVQGTLGRERADAISDDVEPTRQNQPAVMAALSSDPDLADIVRLRSRDRARVVRVLARSEGISRALVPHVIALLSWEGVAEHAVFALRKVAEERVGELTDALLDPNQDHLVRFRLARVLSICVSQRAVEGLLLALDDGNFEVRRQATRSLLAIIERNPLVQVDRSRVLPVVLRELTQSARDLQPAIAPGRASHALTHTFALLALVMERQPLEVAFRGLQGNDPNLVGTAVEYLDEVLPSQIRELLWPYLESRAAVAGFPLA